MEQVAGVAARRAYATMFGRTFPAPARLHQPGPFSPEEVLYMKAYELLFFVDPAATEEARAGAM